MWLRKWSWHRNLNANHTFNTHHDVHGSWRHDRVQAGDWGQLAEANLWVRLRKQRMINRSHSVMWCILMCITMWFQTELRHNNKNLDWRNKKGTRVSYCYSKLIIKVEYIKTTSLHYLKEADGVVVEALRSAVEDLLQRPLNDAAGSQNTLAEFYQTLSNLNEETCPSGKCNVQIIVYHCVFGFEYWNNRSTLPPSGTVK